MMKSESTSRKVTLNEWIEVRVLERLTKGQNGSKYTDGGGRKSDGWGEEMEQETSLAGHGGYGGAIFA